MTRHGATGALAVALALACRAAPPARDPSTSVAASKASRRACEELLTHVIDLTWLAQPTRFHFDAYGEDRHEFERELRSTRGPALVKACRAVPAAHVACAREAADLDGVRACDPRLIPGDWR